MGRLMVIEGRKGAQDAKRGKVFTKVIREISVAARMGGGDPKGNPRLRLAMDKGLAVNMSRDVMERAIKKATGELEGVSYEEIRYEGYAPGGVAVIVDCLTDNKVRTVADVRHAFGKFGGNLGTDGSVAFMFKKVGVLSYAPGADEDKVTEAAIEAGADDVQSDEDGHTIYCAFENVGEVSKALEAALGEAESVKIIWKPKNNVPVDEDRAQSLMKLVATLEDDDDVQNVYANFEVDDETMARLSAA